MKQKIHNGDNPMKQIIFCLIGILLLFSCASKPESKQEIGTEPIEIVSPFDDFIKALDDNNITAVRKLIASGGINMYQEVTGTGSQPSLPVLLYAINTNRSQPILAEIIDCFIEPLDEIVDKQGRDALYYATLRNNAAAIRMLREKNENITGTKTWGQGGK